MDHPRQRRAGPGARALLAFAVVATTATFAPRAARAGAWTRDPGHFYLQLGGSFSFADQRFNLDGKRVPIFVRQFSGATTAPNPIPSNFQQLLWNAYLELGVLDRVTFIGDFQFLNSERQKNEGGSINYSANGVGDLMLGLRFGLLQAPLALAIETRLTLPTGDPNAVIPLGQGDVRGEVRFVASHAFQRVPIYVDFEFGFTLRGNAVLKSELGTTVANYSPETMLHAEIGGTLLRWKYDRVLLVLMAEHRFSTTRPADNREPAFLTIIPESSSFTTVGGSLLVFLARNVGLNLGLRQAVAGSRLPSLTTVGAGVFATY